ncbi:MAG: hypothetical protein ABIH41_02520 [Nanoarchaeota archaeon]
MMEMVAQGVEDVHLQLQCIDEQIMLLLEQRFETLRGFVLGTRKVMQDYPGSAERIDRSPFGELCKEIFHKVDDAAIKHQKSVLKDIS